MKEEGYGSNGRAGWMISVLDIWIVLSGVLYFTRLCRLGWPKHYREISLRACI